MPASCANALRPTTALLGGGKTPGRCDSSWLVRKISRVLTLVRNETDWGRTRPAITISSSEALPARSPMRSEEHTSELQSRSDLVCRLLLEKKKSQAYQPGNAEPANGFL